MSDSIKPSQTCGKCKYGYIVFNHANGGFCARCYYTDIGALITQSLLEDMFETKMTNIGGIYNGSKLPILCKYVNFYNVEPIIIGICHKKPHLKDKYIRLKKELDIRKYICDTYYDAYKNDNIFNNMYVRFCSYGTESDFYNTYNIKRWHKFQFDCIIYFNNIGLNFCNTNENIIAEYTDTTETIEEVKIRLEENFKKFKKIESEYNEMVAALHEAIDIKYDTFDKFADILDISEDDLNVKINKYKSAILHSLCKQDMHSSFAQFYPNKYMTDKTFPSDCLSLIKYMIKHHSLLEHYIENTHPKLKYPSEILKTDIITQIGKYVIKQMYCECFDEKYVEE